LCACSCQRRSQLPASERIAACGRLLPAAKKNYTAQGLTLLLLHLLLLVLL
jgi:hypothetical protein